MSNIQESVRLPVIWNSIKSQVNKKLTGVLLVKITWIVFSSVYRLLGKKLIDQLSICTGLISAINLLLSKDKSDQEKIEGFSIHVSTIGWVCLIMLFQYK